MQGPLRKRGSSTLKKPCDGLSKNLKSHTGGGNWPSLTGGGGWVSNPPSLPSPCPLHHWWSVCLVRVHQLKSSWATGCHQIIRLLNTSCELAPHHSAHVESLSKDCGYSMHRGPCVPLVVFSFCFVDSCVYPCCRYMFCELAFSYVIMCSRVVLSCLFLNCCTLKHGFHFSLLSPFRM